MISMTLARCLGREGASAGASILVSPPELVTDGWKGCFRVLAARVHGHLSWNGYILGPPLCLQIAKLDVVILADCLLDVLDGDFLVRSFERVVQDFFGEQGSRRPWLVLASTSIRGRGAAP
jgi:hypothetical protein